MMKRPGTISQEEIIRELPKDYGKVECSFEAIHLPGNDRVGLVMPTWRRYDYLKICLNSLRQSQLKNTILCIMDESDSEGLGEFSNYRIFRYLDSSGHDLQYIAGSIEEIKVQCDRDPECVAFNSLGYLKYRIRPAKEWIPRRNTEFALYVKKQASSGIQRKSEPLPRSLAASTIRDFRMMDVPTIKIFKKRHAGMYDSLRVGWDLLTNVLGCNFLSCLDADTIVKDNWMARLLWLHKHFENEMEHPYYLVSGFNTRNHPISAKHDHYYIKESIGGLNLFFHRRIYPNLRHGLNSINWDRDFVHRIRAMRGKLICTKPSVVQHIGKSGIWSGGHDYDFADDFD
jgi:glycosyltransferase involved in cell wall biosynthesis